MGDVMTRLEALAAEEAARGGVVEGGAEETEA
jgi:hypothetical protein